ncbi:MAG: anaerobic sulfatase maturase [Firmicutes bacterium]|nr:anaerobic sulfatase maturase [Bacillota bacterium]
MLEDYEPTVEISAEGMPQVRMWRGKPILRFQIACKPAGAQCNLGCTYCYYLSKKELLDQEPGKIMSDEVLEEFIRQNINEQNFKRASFLWRGGEPTLCGIDFFKKVVAFQKKHAPDEIKTENEIQTNGTLLDEEWCSFLKENNFRVILSIDGPSYIHDKFRTDSGGNGSLEKALKAAELLRKFDIRFSTYTYINRFSADYPVEIYRFLRDEVGSVLMNFIPVVELKDYETKSSACTSIEEMPPWDSNAARPGNEDSVVTQWSVDPDQWGSFLCSVFDEWYDNDIGKVNIFHFESIMYAAEGKKPPMCIFGPLCGKWMAVEADGNVYSCERFVYPDYSIGNIMQAKLKEILFSKEQHKFAYGKLRDLTSDCRDCRYLDWCYGECLKNRFIQSPTGKPGHNYLCRGYKKFFSYTEERVRTIKNRQKS